MKFESYLNAHRRAAWSDDYVNYSALKRLLHEVLHAPHAVYIPTKLSLSSGALSSAHGASRVTWGKEPGGISLQTGLNDDFTAQELFFLALEREVSKVNTFSLGIASQLRSRVTDLQVSIKITDLTSAPERQALMSVAKSIGDEYLQLEKYCNLNYAGLQKILKKHDKLLPEAPCYHFYKTHISSQPWVQGDHQDIQMSLSRVFSELHRSHGKIDLSMLHSGKEEYTLNYWVRQEDILQVKHVILQHIPAVERSFDEFESDMIVNTLYLDSNSLELYHNLLYGRPYSTQMRLRWRGFAEPNAVQVQRKVYQEGWRPETAVEDAFPLPENKVAEFLLGRLSFAHAHKFIQQQQELASTSKLTDSEAIAQEYKLFKAFTEIQHLIESKTLQPMVRVVHREEEFQGDVSQSGIRIVLQEEIEALLEFSCDGMNRLANGIWHQEQPADRIEFPYILMKVRSPLSSSSSHQLPSWLMMLIESELITEVYDFSKMSFGVCGLLPDMVRAVPVWIDDHELQRFLYMNIVQREDGERTNGDLFGMDDPMNAQDADSVVADDDRFEEQPLNPSQHSLISKQKSGLSRISSRFSQDSVGVYSEEGRKRLLEKATERVKSGVAAWQAKLVQRQGSAGKVYDSNVVMRMEPKQLMQNERVFLRWVSLSITMAGLSVGMLGFASKARTDPTENPTLHISEVTAFILMACAMYICGYGLLIFMWRTPRLTLLHATRYDDTSGTMYLNLIIVLAFGALFWINIADLIEIMTGDDGS
ncbi:hypothetical protein CEUSTIGMA_g8904.t1 [Chlamydomonas eustigma]|uniref:SPX domain-containing protein n=1 Tax=Chlamydomonas eustigma TaxID=1157962 RepID=A0A250XEG9_9CHLO|nr:hypothetical protein CEUSTIGMA_g8904.t1 [Chlamydomonas eustigma]|eukprot:GAX81475.1 hypothetical protein CEUSTIGMA_g8904.t1 [Chlamydomonas eustigma]